MLARQHHLRHFHLNRQGRHLYRWLHRHPGAQTHQCLYNLHRRRL